MKFVLLFLLIVTCGCSARTSTPPPLRSIDNNILREERVLNLQEIVQKMDFIEKSDTKYAIISLKYAIKNGEKAYREKFIEVQNIHKNILVSDFLDTLDIQVTTELEAKNKIEAKLAIDRAFNLVK